ncbi:MAG: SDR family oxidoreductase, partial [Chloroflexi bacterium]|nr:SDR family oxidoreductase [Chloroflexota bacterium]
SMAGVTGQERHAAYAATKGGINSLTKSAAVDWGPDRVRVNALCPAGVWTDALRVWCDEQPNKQEAEEYLHPHLRARNNARHVLGHVSDVGNHDRRVGFSAIPASLHDYVRQVDHSVRSCLGRPDTDSTLFASAPGGAFRSCGRLIPGFAITRPTGTMWGR